MTRKLQEKEAKNFENQEKVRLEKRQKNIKLKEKKGNIIKKKSVINKKFSRSKKK